MKSILLCGVPVVYNITVCLIRYRKPIDFALFLLLFILIFRHQRRCRRFRLNSLSVCWFGADLSENRAEA